jgi:hypothetical protein
MANPYQGSIGGVSFDFTPEGIAKLQSSLAAKAASSPAGASPQQAQNAILAGQASNVNNLSYVPIDTKAIAAEATQQAAQNAAQSLALEQQLSPGVASTRSGVQNQIAANVALGGNLPADVVNQISRSVGAQAGSSGLLGSQAPLTAATLGTSALALQAQRLAQGQQLLAANQPPVAGLDPGALASATIANQNAANNFALQKLGAQGNIANSQIGQLQSQLMANAAGNGGGSTTIGGGTGAISLGDQAASNATGQYNAMLAANGGYAGFPSNGVTSLPGSYASLPSKPYVGPADSTAGEF